MCDHRKDIDERLESEVRDHLSRYVEKYDKLPDKNKGGLDLLEYRIDGDPKSNHIIDRDLLADYLSLRIAKSNNALQKWVAVFAFASTISAVIQVLRILNWIP